MDNIKTGVELIAEERKRQVEVEGRTADHDLRINGGSELAFAAAAYAIPDHAKTKDFKRTHLWPWSKSWWKPSPDNRVKELTKAGALIAAEIDRLNSSPLK